MEGIGAIGQDSDQDTVISKEMDSAIRLVHQSMAKMDNMDKIITKIVNRICILSIQELQICRLSEQTASISPDQ